MPAAPGLKEYHELTPKQRAFCDVFVETGNACEALRQSGYALPKSYGALRVKAHEIKHNEHVKANWTEMIRAKHMSEEEAIAKRSDVARFDIGDFLYEDPLCCPECGHEINEGTGRIRFDLKKAKQAGATAMIKNIRELKDGRVNVDFYPADDAQRDILKVHGSYKKNDGPDLSAFDELVIAARKKDK